MVMVGIEKTKVMAVRKRLDDNTPQLQVDRGEIKVVEQFAYLG